MKSLIADCLLLCGLALVLHMAGVKLPGSAQAPAPVVIAPPATPDKQKPRRPRLESGGTRERDEGERFAPRSMGPLTPAADLAGLATGGSIGPDGKTEVTCDLPSDLLFHNTGGKDGAGLCVFASLTYAAIYQNEQKLVGLFEAMKKERGGGYPQKVDAMIAKYGPGARYVQYEGSDPAILKAALASGRMPCVTYNGHDPHYRGSIAHMVDLVCYDEQANLAAIRDNNFTGPSDLVWMTCAEFLKRWKGDGGWAVVLLSPPPPPPPRNQ